MNIELNGRRVIIVARCSTNPQAEESIPRQLELGRAYANDHGMIVVDEVSLGGKSASLRQHEPALRDLIQRKETISDFDTLWFLTLSRFDRSRQEGEKLFQALDEAEILVVTQKEGTFTGRFGWLFRQVHLDQAQGNVEELAFQCASGSMVAILKGRLPHTNNRIYGIDKLYRNADGEPQFIVRHLSQGNWQRFDLNGNSLGKVRKISSEEAISFIEGHGSVRLIPGAADRVETVVNIFKRHHNDGWGPTRIARELNGQGIPSPMGKLWCDGTIKKMLANPVYFLGKGWTNTSTVSKYVKRGIKGPVVHVTPRKQKPRRDGNGICKYPPRVIRPLDERVKVEYEELRDFLPEPLRQMAAEEYHRAERKKAEHDAELNVAGRKSGGNKHIARHYPLTGHLRTQNGGKMCGSNDRGRRQYIASGQSHRSGLKKGITLPAAALEQVVLNHLAEAFGVPNLRSTLEASVNKIITAMFPMGQDLQALSERKTEIEDEYKRMTQDLGKHGRRLNKPRADQLEKEIDHVEQQIAHLSGKKMLTGSQVADLIESCATKLKRIVKEPELASKHGRLVHKLLSYFVSRLVINMETNPRRLEIAISIPSWVISRPNLLVELDNGVVVTSDSSSSHEAGLGIPLKSGVYMAVKIGRCIEWHRKSA